MKTICGTGHRPGKLGGYGEPIYDRLIDLAEAALKHYKPELVISGMALGWDQVLAQGAINVGIPFIAAVPFVGQENAWPEHSQNIYDNILDHADEVVIVSEALYHPRLMQVRNEWMVDHSDWVLALWDGTSGGTRNCLMYAIANDVPFVNLWNSWVKYK